MDLRAIYKGYLECLNGQNWPALGNFVHDQVSHNGRPFGLSGYRAMLESDFRQIPDLFFQAELLACDPPIIAARLAFTCSPRGVFLGVPVNGRTVSFAENIFYLFEDGRIRTAWSIIDRAAIEDQLRP
jgi:predicted ester cyclase